MNTQSQLPATTKKWGAIQQAVVPLLATLMMVGCGVSATPAESDAKKQLEMLFKNCDLISVHDFKKINGVQQPDGNYLVSVEYLLRSTPSSDSRKKWEEFAPQKDAYKAKERQINEDFKQVYSERSKQSVILDSMRDRDSPQYAEALAKMQKLDEVWTQLNASGKTLLEEHNIIIGAEAKLKKELSETYFRQCKISTSLIPMLDGLIGRDTDAFGSIKEKSYHDNFRLIKTDKGWYFPINVAR
ncbi:hypothetical protein [uncultured Propionivibrio sp.]|uniref:hypothetical protein n=1 Tax=uncultured Propionivibrio sp. TaxID=426737 RepID=UPI0029C0DBD0|nr:hypothetical protein [uncultured Propionivibrio sp.]